MKLSFRMTITGLLLLLLFSTVAGLGINAARNSRFIAEDLSTQILAQTSRLIDSQVNDLLRHANDQGQTDLRLLETGQIDLGRFPEIARYWLTMLEVHPRLNRISVGLEATGEWFYVQRHQGRLAIGELARNPKTGALDLAEREPGKPPFFSRADQDRLDPRVRDWYAAAKAARRQVWSETYVLFGARGEETVPGASCATPTFGPDGRLVGVFAASFDMIELSRYLGGLKVGEDGYAFVIEVRADRSRRVIAHKDPKILVKAVGGEAEGVDLVPIEQLDDPLIPAFLEQVPSDLDPGTFREIRRIGFERDGVRYLGAYSCLTREDTPNWLIGIVLPEADVMARVERSNAYSVAVGLIVLLVAAGTGLYLSAQVARPLERVALETRAIGAINFDPKPVAHSVVEEVDRLAVAIEDAKTSLRSFQKYVPRDVIRKILATGQETTMGGERRRMTISFCDLANFTTLAETLPPEDLVYQMADYFGRLSLDIMAERGTVDKYIGDAIMALWGAPEPSETHALDACKAALRNQRSLADLAGRWKAAGKPELTARIGIMTGDAVVGNVGSPARLNYTAMGDPVNLASRLEGLGKYYGCNILIGEPTYLDAKELVVARVVDRVSAKGKTGGMLVYELLALRGAESTEFEEIARLADEAMGHYQAREWAEALRIFEGISRVRPDDGPSRILADRCRAYIDQDPGAEWDGVHRMASK